MTHKENITAILECYFTGFKEEIIDSACNRILEQESKTDVLDKIRGYIDHIRNAGLGKKKSLEFIEKFIDGLKAEKGGRRKTEVLIRREAAINACLNGWNEGFEEIVKEIRALPTVQQKEGHWIPVGHDINDYPYFKCSECGRVDDAKGYYCRWCGVRMNESKEL